MQRAASVAWAFSLSDEDITADDIVDAVASDVVDGVQAFSDGTNSVTAMDPQKRLDVADRIRRAEASENTNFGLRFTTLNGPGAW